jgi:hypothetical protein
MDAASLAVADAEGRAFGSRIPSFSQVIDWSNILLDAVDFMHVHHKQQSRAEEASSSNKAVSSLQLAELVQSLAAHVTQHHLQFLDRSQDLKGFLSVFSAKRNANTTPMPQARMLDYSVEIMELSA